MSKPLETEGEKSGQRNCAHKIQDGSSLSGRRPGDKVVEHSFKAFSNDLVLSLGGRFRRVFIS